MKTTLTILAAMMVALPTMAGTTTEVTAPAPAPSTDEFADVSALSAKRLSGLVSMGYDSNYCGRGIVISHSVAQGDSAQFIAMKLNYDFGRKGYWSFDNMVAYRTVTSGHTMYGNPQASDEVKWQAALQKNPGATREQLKAKGFNPRTVNAPVKQANLENEFSVNTSFRYTRDMWNVGFGHSFVHGGLLGVMAKHYRDQGASCTNEGYVSVNFTPTKWFELGVTTSYSFQGITGWWFEPHATFKAPIIGDPEHIKLAGVLTFGLSATADYFQSEYFACQNGTQAFWIKLSTPFFVTDNFILTPYVSTNWLGKGALKANEKSEFRKYSGDDNCVPFRNFGVVGGISATYTF